MYTCGKHKQINSQLNINKFMHNFYTTYILITKLKNKGIIAMRNNKPIPGNNAILLQRYSGKKKVKY